MGNHAEQHLQETSEPVSVRMGGYSEKLRFAVFALRHKVYPCKQWLASHRANLDWFTTEVVIKHRGKEYRFIAVEPKEFQQISLNTIANDHRKMFPLFAVILRTSDLANDVHSEAIPEPIRGVLNDYQKVFPEYLPHILPPKGAHDFYIELETDSKSQRKGLYRMVFTELDGLRTQLDELS